VRERNPAFLEKASAFLRINLIRRRCLAEMRRYQSVSDWVCSGLFDVKVTRQLGTRVILNGSITLPAVEVLHPHTFSSPDGRAPTEPLAFLPRAYN
jgi:hypothetical protein